MPGTPWPERRAGSLGAHVQLYSGLVIDVATDTAYALVPRSVAPDRGPYRLTCAVLPAGPVRKGPTLHAAGLALASGYLWALGQSGGAPVITQIDPRSMRVVRSIALPGVATPVYPALHLTSGPAHSVWAGSARTGRTAVLYRISTTTGRILATARLPARTVAADLAASPSGTVLYASAARTVRGGTEGNLVLEYDGRSGRPVAAADRGLVTYSVTGSALTAVPGGVWVSFRTGMLGLTLHLRQPDLALRAPPGPGVAGSAATSLFHWPMYATTTYGGGSLWLANQTGVMACLDAATGRVRARERLHQADLIFQLVAVDPARHQVDGADSRGLVTITPPAACWAR